MPSQSPAVRWAVAAGNTVRITGLQGCHFVLVCGAQDGPLTRRWYQALRHAGHPRARHCIVATDWAVLGPHVHVRPACMPAFLVTRDGFVVDWFPAPPLDSETDPVDLLLRTHPPSVYA